MEQVDLSSNLLSELPETFGNLHDLKVCTLPSTFISLSCNCLSFPGWELVLIKLENLAQKSQMFMWNNKTEFSERLSFDYQRCYSWDSEIKSMSSVKQQTVWEGFLSPKLSTCKTRTCALFFTLLRSYILHTFHSETLASAQKLMTPSWGLPSRGCTFRCKVHAIGRWPLVCFILVLCLVPSPVPCRLCISVTMA